MDKKDYKLLNWRCPENCPNRKMHKVNNQIISCHYFCKEYLEAKKFKDNFNKEQQELKAIGNYDLQNFSIKKSIRSKKGR